MDVDDPDDPRLLAYTRLTDEALRRRREGPGGDLAGMFICEGAAVTRRALEAGLHPVSVLVATDMVDRLPDLPTDVPVYLGSPELVETVIGFRFHRGFVAAFQRPGERTPHEVLEGACRVMVGENVTNPTNLGVMVRSGSALGMDGLLIDPTTCDPLYRRVVRVSMGTVFSLPFARLDAFPEGLATLRTAGFRLIGLSPDPTVRPIAPKPAPDRIALVLGAEATGLSHSTMDYVDELVRIPMREGIDSLNVGAAAAIAAYVIGGLDA